jgi:formylglycine-generating enzyme required for sulfatase activity
MVFVEGGTFTMGCLPERDGECNASELPAHSVTLSSFYISKYEVTQAQWVAVMDTNPSSNRSDDQLPVSTLKFENVQEFFVQLNNTTGKNYRLPTEAEWEYAARGGKHKSPYQYSGSNDLNEVGWYSCGRAYTVSSKKPNALGIYDMTGNVFEWSGTWGEDYPSVAQTDPTGPDSGTYIVVRGGSWMGGVADCRVATRIFVYPNTSYYRHIGIRLVLPLY